MIDHQAPWDFASICEIARLNPHMTAEQIGRHVADTATRDQVRDLVVTHLAGLVEAVRREEAVESP